MLLKISEIQRNNNMWESRGGRITNGELSLSFVAAWEYIVHHTAVRVMIDLEIDHENYREFRKVVCKHLTVPEYLCGRSI